MTKTDGILKEDFFRRLFFKKRLFADKHDISLGTDFEHDDVQAFCLTANHLITTVADLLAKQRHHEFIRLSPGAQRSPFYSLVSKPIAMHKVAASSFLLGLECLVPGRLRANHAVSNFMRDTDQIQSATLSTLPLIPKNFSLLLFARLCPSFCQGPGLCYLSASHRPARAPCSSPFVLGH